MSYIDFLSSLFNLAFNSSVFRLFFPVVGILVCTSLINFVYWFIYYFAEGGRH